MNKTGSNCEEKPWLRNYDAHVNSSLVYPDVSLVDLFDEQSKKNPGIPFLIYKDKLYTYHEVWSYVNAFAHSLIKHGVINGDRVAMLLPNCPQFIIAYYAILKAGGIVVALNPQYPSHEYIPLLKKTSPSMIICTNQHKAELLNNFDGDKYTQLIISDYPEECVGISDKRTDHQAQDITFKFNDLLIPTKEDDKTQFPKVKPRDRAVFQFSGGTTGNPNAAIGLHKNIVANVSQFINWCDLQSGNETILAAIPLYHVYGMVLAMNMSLALGGRMVIIDDARQVEKILESIENYHVTFYPGVPAMYYAINQNENVHNGAYKLDSLKACISGSYTLHKSIKEEFENYTGAKLVEGYGLSEAPTATHCNPIYGVNKTGSIGLPLPDVSCRVVDLSTGMNDVERGREGELIIQGPQIMAGYFGSPVDEKMVMRQGWLYTGDVVRMDEDGYFYIVDRKKSLIKVGGMQVWPNEIEAIINSHPEIIECAVGGVPDLVSGEKIIAWVIKQKGSLIIENDIMDWCKGKLVSYKIPSEIYFNKEIPKSGVGKTLRRVLIDDYKKQTQKG